MHYSVFKSFLVHFCVIIVVTGCTGLPERNPLPESLSDTAVIPGIDDARYWADEPPPETENWFKLTKEELEAKMAIDRR